MSKLKGLLLTEGLHGMISQVEGLAKELDLDYFHEKIELNSFWKFIPPNLTPISKFVFKNQLRRDFDIIISCGRKSVIPSIYLKRNSKKKIINIHIQDPKISFDKFDFIVAPDHDGLKGPNVYTSKGAIHYLTTEEVNEARNYLENKIEKNKDVVSLILGGPTKHYDYSDANMINIFSKINKNLIDKNLQLIVVRSNRTPQKTINLAKEYFGDAGMLGYVKNVQRKEIREGIACVKHQNMSGSDMGDDHKEYFAGEAALKAAGKDNTMNQF